MAHAVEERLDAQAVAQQDQAAGGAVPQGDREHSVQAGDKLQAVLIVQVRNDLAVAGSAQHVTLGCQLAAQLDVVVDLSVEDRLHGSRAILDGLFAGQQIQHRQAPHPQAGSSTDVEAFSVRSPVADNVTHARDQLARRRRASGRNACDPAHEASGGTQTRVTLAQLHADLVAYEAQWRLQRGEALDRRTGVGQ